MQMSETCAVSARDSNPESWDPGPFSQSWIPGLAIL